VAIPKWFASADVQFITRNNDETLIIPRTGGPVLLPSKHAEALRECSYPASLHEHAENLVRSGTYRSRDEAIRLLLSLMSKNLLCGMLFQEDGGLLRPYPPFDAVVLHTTHRVRECSRNIFSICEAVKDYSDIEITVFDDCTDDPHNRQEMVGVLRQISEDTGVRVRYFGAQERDLLLAFLIDRGAASSLIRLLLLKTPGVFSAGAMRNIAQLVMGARSYLSVDDDVVWDVITDERCRSGTWMVGHEPPMFREFSLEGKRVIRRRQTRVPGHIACRAVQSMLGESFKRLNMTTGLHYQGECRHLRNSWYRGDGVVPIVQLGIWGDCGMNSGDWLFNSNSSLKSQMADCDNLCKAVTTSREISKISQAALITHDPGFMSFAAGICGAHPLPPFPPRYRNEDGVFANVLLLASTSSFIGHVPFAVLHDPQSQCRTYNDGTEVRPSDFLLDAVATLKCSLGNDPASNYRRLGTLLKEKFTEGGHQALRMQAIQICSSRLQGVAQALESSPPRSALASHLREMESRLLKRLCDLSTCESISLRKSSEANPAEPSSSRITLDFLIAYGDAVRTWEDLRSEAINYSNAALEC
jgi:hypothetical protein